MFSLFRPCPEQFDRAPEHRSVGRIHHPIEAFAREKPLGDQCLDLQFQEPVRLRRLIPAGSIPCAAAISASSDIIAGDTANPASNRSKSG